jgi:transcriptional regulator GlxA family with amidase domain
MMSGGNVKAVAFYAMSEQSSAKRLVALVGYPGAQSLDIVGPLEVFTMANRFGDPRAYEVILASPAGGTIVCNSGLSLGGSVALADVPVDLDTILVAGGNEDALRRVADQHVLQWLNERTLTTRRMGSVCSGALVLAAAGVLDGRRATTHWGYCDEMRKFRPAVRLEPDAIFVADPPFYTSAGVTAGIDLCLSLVEADQGPQVALAVARNLVLFMRRPGGQTQYSAGLNVQAAATPRLRQLIADVSADPTGDLSVPELAARAAMSERTFSRVFQKETGVGPATFVEIARVNRAKALLETSDWSLGRVAERAGFGSVEGLHRAFNKRVGATPGEYRARFGHVPLARDGAASG